jgi:hypothetical protein
MPRVRSILALVALTTVAAAVSVRSQGPGAPAARSAKAAAPIDLTGYWVAVVNEDWRFRMITPAKGDYGGIPITKEALQIVNAWNPSADESAGNQCKSYGAAAIMRVPGRVHVTWQDDDTLRVDTDAGTQTRLFRFTSTPASTAKPTWQGTSAARWEAAGGRGGAPASGALTVVTTNLRAGYLRKNGVPYSENARVTEHFDVAPLGQDGRLLVVTTIVDDPRYLTQPLIVSSHFKKEPDGSKWDPTPCSATW